jgi:hypothetical protein
MFFNCQLATNLVVCSENSLHSWIKFFFSFRKFTIVNAPIYASETQPFHIGKWAMVFVSSLAIAPWPIPAR